MHRATILSRETLAEAAQYRPGTEDHKYRLRAAWNQAQMGAGIPACDWTDDPPPNFGADHLNDNRRAA